MQMKFYLIIENLSSIPISGAEVQLSGPPHVELIIKSRKIRAKKKINKIYFSISAKELGFFTLTAILTSEAGHRITFPIKIRVEPRDFSYYYEDSRIEQDPEELTFGEYLRVIWFIIGLITMMILLSITLRPYY